MKKKSLNPEQTEVSVCARVCVCIRAYERKSSKKTCSHKFLCNISLARTETALSVNCFFFVRLIYPLCLCRSIVYFVWSVLGPFARLVRSPFQPNRRNLFRFHSIVCQLLAHNYYTVQDRRIDRCKVIDLHAIRFHGQINHLCVLLCTAVDGDRSHDLSDRRVFCEFSKINVDVECTLTMVLELPKQSVSPDLAKSTSDRCIDNRFCVESNRKTRTLLLLFTNTWIITEKYRF